MRNNLIEKEKKKMHILLTNAGTTDIQIHNRYSCIVVYKQTAVIKIWPLPHAKPHW